MADLQALSLPGIGRGRSALDSETANALACSLVGLRSLVELDVCGMPSEAADVLARALQQLTGLTRLKLFYPETHYHSYRVRLPAADIIIHIGSDCRLLEAAGSIAGLRSLSMLGFYCKDDQSPQLIASALGALAGLTRLEELDMRHSRFSAEAATALAGALEGLTRLKKLNMEHIEPGLGGLAEAATAFAGTLTRLTQLTELTMGSCSSDATASPEAVAALTAPLVALTSLTKLATYEGPCSPATIETLASALGRMPALTWLNAGPTMG